MSVRRAIVLAQQAKKKMEEFDVVARSIVLPIATIVLRWMESKNAMVWQQAQLAMVMHDEHLQAKNLEPTANCPVL